MAKATQKIATTKKKTTISIKPKTSSSSKSKGTGSKRCPTCGKFMG